MGALFQKLKRSSSKTEVYKDSQAHIYYFFIQAFTQFLAGLFIGLAVFLFSIFLTLNVDTTQTSVIDTNLRCALILMSGSFALVSYMGLKGAFGYSLFEIGLGSYESLLTFSIAVMETRITRENWGQVVIPFVHIATTCSGIFATAALFKASYGVSAIPIFLKPVLVNAVQQNLGWAYLWSSLVYTGIFITIMLTTNATGQYYANLMPGTCIIWVLGLVQLYTNRMLPSFAFNWPWCYLTDSYELLGIDVAAGFTGLVVAGVLYWLCYSRLFKPTWTDGYETSRVPYANQRYTKLEDTYNQVTNKAAKIRKTRTREGDPDGERYYEHMNNNETHVFDVEDE